MPCGGICPAESPPEIKCIQCNRSKCDHFVEEWDAYLHGRCVEVFLETDEGQTVIAHGHLIQIDDKIIQEEK